MRRTNDGGRRKSGQIRRAGALLAIGLSLAAAAAAQVRSAGLRGMVLYADGSPAHARLLLGQAGRYSSFTTRTREGRSTGFDIGNLAPGRYDLIVSASKSRPRRYWGIDLQAQSVRQSTIQLEEAADRRSLYLMIESGAPGFLDTPRQWKGGWLEGCILREDNFPADGSVGLFRNFMRLETIPLGQPTLPGYFQNRNLSPGAYDLIAQPPEDSGWRQVRLKGFEIREDCRTFLDPIILPKGDPKDPPIDIPVPSVRHDGIRRAILPNRR